MSDDFKLQVNFKVGQDLINIRAGSVLELGLLLDALPHEEIANARAALGAVSAVAPIAAAVQPAVTQVNVPQNVPAAPVQLVPVQNGGVQSASDRFGNHYTKGLPNAPACQHGPMLKANKQAKSGKRYDAWVCGGDGALPPTIRSADACKLQFID